MAGSRLPDFLRRLRLRLSPAEEGTADADLLERFLASRDEAAFEALVGRHGSMVLGVCGRVLGDSHAAERAMALEFPTMRAGEQVLLQSRAGRLPALSGQADHDILAAPHELLIDRLHVDHQAFINMTKPDHQQR